MLHIGAHEAEEWEDYVANGVSWVTWVESQPTLAMAVAERVASDASLAGESLNLTLWSKGGVRKELQILSNSASSSLLPLGTHQDSYPDILPVRTISVVTSAGDDVEAIRSRKYDLINVDVQGVELEVLKGLTKRIGDATLIYCEVNREEVFKGNALVNEIDRFMGSQGFLRSGTVWTGAGWGDAVYVKIQKDAQLRVRAGLFRLVTAVANLKLVLAHLARRLRKSCRKSIRFLIAVTRFDWRKRFTGHGRAGRRL